MLPWLVDGAMGACAVLAIDGSWLHRLFPPLVLLGMLHLRPAAERLTFADFARDRAVLAVLFAIAAGFGVAEPAIMATGLALMALNMAENGGMARLTRT